MRAALVMAAALLAAPTAWAADAMAGKEAAGACFACHGANGISVAEEIPNLAGQKAKYIVAQLKAFKGETRKNPLMNAIAAQLEDAQMEDIAAFFSGLQGSTGDALSEFLPALKGTPVKFPEGYQESFTHFHTVDFPDRKQVRKYLANKPALEAARKGEDLPNGAYILVEAYTAKLDDQKMPVKDASGRLEADKLIFYTAMEKQAGWGEAVPEILRNGDWNYAVFKGDKSTNTAVNQAACLACHKPLTKSDYVFLMKELQDKAKM